MTENGVNVWCVSVATIHGQLFTLEAASGNIVSQIQLPGQIFSSPVAMGNRLVVGCRDNCLYCVDIFTGTEKT